MTDLFRSLLAVVGSDAVSADPVDRLAYSHDAFPLALKMAGLGKPFALPELIVFPDTTEEVAAIMRIAHKYATPIVPFGGGSGIVGGALPVLGGIVVDLKRLATIDELDPVSRLVTVGAGINGQRLEDYLNERGFTTGHYPQSLRSSTVGGWIAHRAVGTASTRYGGIESLVAGMEVVLTSGDVLRLQPSPRTSTGPDLRQLFIGGEGTLGIVTRATLRIRTLPEARQWLAFTFSGFSPGLDAIRCIVQGGIQPAVVRLYDEHEARDLFQAGGVETGVCLLFLSCEGDPEQVNGDCIRVERLISKIGGTQVSPSPAQHWWKDRFNTRSLLKTLHTPLGLADALEVAAPWRVLPNLYVAMSDAMMTALTASGRPGIVYGHTSHAYIDGANLYMIFHGEAGSTEELPALYARVLNAAFSVCRSLGATLSHHHGIGLAKAKWLAWEFGEIGMNVLRAVQKALDPDGLLNPGKIGSSR